jgi:hypothetical protein
MSHSRRAHAKPTESRRPQMTEQPPFGARVTLVTSASGGIGQAIAEALAAEGAAVALPPAPATPQPVRKLRRYEVGVTPSARAKWARIVAGPPKPLRTATCSIGSWVVSSSS